MPRVHQQASSTPMPCPRPHSPGHHFGAILSPGLVSAQPCPRCSCSQIPPSGLGWGLRALSCSLNSFSSSLEWKGLFCFVYLAEVCQRAPGGRTGREVAWHSRPRGEAPVLLSHRHAWLVVRFGNLLSAVPALGDVTNRAVRPLPRLSEGSPAAVENTWLQMQRIIQKHLLRVYVLHIYFIYIVLP